MDKRMIVLMNRYSDTTSCAATLTGSGRSKDRAGRHVKISTVGCEITEFAETLPAPNVSVDDTRPTQADNALVVFYSSSTISIRGIKEMYETHI